MIKLLSIGALLVLGIAETAVGAAAEEAGGGSPITSARDGLITALTTLLIFALLVAVLGKYAWGPIASGLRAREEKIRRDIADAEAARKRAEQTLQEYNAQLAAAEGRVRELLAKAATDGERLATSIRMQAQQEAEEAKERANKDIEAAKNAAIRELYEEAGTLATTIAEKILRRNLNADDQRELVRSSLEQLQTVGK